ncbi:n-acyl-phosphatidylethanolamine-hydrolyzing phospholipase d-like [Nannochloropsis oceanica]
MFGRPGSGSAAWCVSDRSLPAVRPFAAAAAAAGGGRAKRKEKASTSSRTSLTLQGLSFAFNKLRRHPTQAEGDKKSIGVRSSPVVMNGRFYNPWNTDAAMKSVKEFIELMMDRKGWPRMPPEELAELRETLILPPSLARSHLEAIHAHHRAMLTSPHGQNIRVSWMNHSTILVQMGGFNFLTDPIWGERCSPVSFAGPRRTFPPPHPLKDLPPIDFVLLSHNHYDHLDVSTLETLGPDVTYYVPLGIKPWMERRGYHKCEEMSWWDEGTIRKTDADGHELSLTLACTPAQHWSSRNPFDRMKSLWCSWAVMTDETGKEEGKEDVPRQRASKIYRLPTIDEYGPFDVAAIPIGAYLPRWFMKDQHIDPQAALDVHHDIKAKQSFGIHWGTFPLAGDAWNEGPRELVQTRTDRGLADDSFFLLRPGESWEVGSEREGFLEHFKEEERRPLSH